MDVHLCLILSIIFVDCKTYGLIVSTGYQNPEVLPVIGEHITLACTFRPSSSFSVLYWYGNDTILAQVTCPGEDCEQNILDESKYRLMTDSSSGNLTIKNLTEDDSGYYNCLITTSYDAFSKGIELEVMLSALPRMLMITDDRSLDGYKDGTYVSMTSGQTYNLTCSVQGAIPPAVLEWQISDEVQLQRHEQYNAVQDDAYISRKVVSLTPSIHDHGKVLGCIVSHQKLENELQTSVILDVQVLPNDLRLIASEFITTNALGTRSANFTEDTPASFLCRSEGSRPKALISWSIGSINDPGSTTSTSTPNEADHNLWDTLSTLQLIPTRRHHNQLLRCVAEAGINQRQAELNIIVHGPPDPPYLNGTQELQDGVSATVKCTSNNGYPAPTFQWYFGSQNVTSSSKIWSSTNMGHRVNATSVLTFTPTVHDHGKSLRCEVFQPTSPPKKSGSVSEVLSVLYSPVIVNFNVRRVSKGKRGIHAIFTCISDGTPLPSTLWFVNDTELTNSTRYQIHNNVPKEGSRYIWSMLIISNIQEMDEVTYTCLAKSRIGNDSSTVTLTSLGCRASLAVSSQLPDELPVTGENFEITCTYSPPSNSSVIRWKLDNNIIASVQCTSVLACVYIFNSTKFELKGTADDTSLTIKNLTIDDNRNYECSVLNIYGYDASITKLEVLSPAPPTDVIISDDRSPVGYPDNSYIFMTTVQPRDITCTVRGARPSALIEWHSNANDVHIQPLNQSNAVDGQSYISQRVARISSSKDGHNRVIRCLVSHRELQNVLQATVRLHISVPPSELQLTTSLDMTNESGTPSLVIFQNVSSVVNCTCFGARPPAILSFELGNAVITGGITSSVTQNQMDNSLYDTQISLRVLPRRNHHYKMLRCFVPNRQNELQAEVKLVVYGPPDDTILQGTGDLQSGVPAVIECISSNGYPAPIFRWMLGTTDLTAGSETQEELNEDNRVRANSFLMFTPKKSDYGKHLVCQIFHPRRHVAWSRSVWDILYITYSPVIVDLAALRSIDGNGNVSVLFTCQVDARPQGDIHWFFNGAKLENDTTTIIYKASKKEETVTSTLIINNEGTINEGKYECLATTKLGSDRVAANSTIICELRNKS